MAISLPSNALLHRLANPRVSTSHFQPLVFDRPARKHRKRDFPVGLEGERMTYCCSIHVRDGIVAIAEQRVVYFVAEGFENPAIVNGLIECAPETPYFQICGHRCDKPILNRAVSFETHIYDALKILLISMHAAAPTPPSRGVHA
jgi:hypothetical protein